MSRLVHTYGPTCQLGPSVAFSGSKGDEEIPPLKAHYFYSSPQPIDDPLSVIPIPSSTDSKSANHPPCPFSPYDNNALEEAWVDITSGKEKKLSWRRKTPSPTRKSPATQHAAASSGSTSKLETGRHKKNTSRSEAVKSFTPADSSEQVLTSAVALPARTAGHSENMDVTRRTNESDPQHSKGDRQSHSSNAICPELSETRDSEEAEEPVGDDGGASQSIDQSPKAKRLKASKKNKSTNDAQEDSLGYTSQHEVSEPRGNPHNPNCDDPHHLNMDSRIVSCCAEFESGNRADHAPCIANKGTMENHHSSAQPSNTKTTHSQKETSKRKHKSDFHETVEAQGDATDGQNSTEPIGTLDGHGTRGDESARGKSKKAEIQSSAADDVPAQGDAGTTGRPFVKLTPRSPEESAAEDGEMGGGEPCTYSEHSETRRERESEDAETVNISGCKAQKNSKSHAEVPVGISRLHMVTLPALQMKPIYWSPVHDIAAVTRGTWFYKDTMYPIEPAVANQLELGYRELKPWSQTWSDELSSALEVGAVGEEKIAHHLWPKELPQQGKSRKGAEHTLFSDPYCAAKCFQGEAAAEGSIDPDDSEKKPTDSKTVTKKYSTAQVIYKDAQNAFILRPKLQPSAYYGRKPLSKIRKGATVGIHVLRGFDWKLWDRLHPMKKTGTASKAEQNAPVAGDADVSKGTACPACKAQEERQKVTDLILVIHGIGQKLSERMESFHFTHAINGFRRSINAELVNDAVRKTLRGELGGVMVLPVNWRSNLSFEDGGPKKEGDKEAAGTDFTMKDITPDTIPAVRNIISDVMLDIPFYMSHHKPKMIRAAICEANRVYQLWCRNNPEFQHKGRVHIIAHSLGSAMAIEIMSKQPTVVPKIDPHAKKINAKHLDFNTTNLFLCGSPAGFFLLLDKGKLIPRRGQGKPGAEAGDDTDKAIVGDVGTFGCLAVDNIYNIMHYNDPIAYRLNAAVDPLYAASLKNAQVPSATTGFFESIGNAMRSMTPGVGSPAELAIGQVPKPGAIARLPSQLEMEVHDFTREEIAEKKFYLMNDCGQVDWFLSSGGGPLEIQYLNMLSAHSSYWGSPDFIRFIVVEVGRKPGRDHALPNMRVAKIGRKEVGRKA